MKVRFTLALAATCVLAAVPLPSAQIIRESLATELVEAGAVEYAVLLPDGYDPGGARLPLVLMLHGSGGDREQLARFQPQIQAMWAAGELPEMILAAPSVATGSIYMDSYDSTNRWETFIMTEFLPHLRDTFRASAARESTMVTGISMGGFGSLRLGFKHPETFGAVAAMEPGAWPGLTWEAVPDRNKIRPPERIAELFGDPFDEERFQRENPASIVQNAAERLRDSAIYIEVGDEDFLGIMEGVDFMHRLLWRHRLRHEFRLVRWADHTGSTITERSRDRFRFLARFLAQPADPEPAVQRQRERIAAGHSARGMEPFGYWPNSTLRSYDTADGALNYRRALRDSQEVREERGVIRIADIAYNERPGVDPQRQSLDLYLREGLTDAPVVLYVHGGSWVRGDKARALFKPTALVPEGYLFASMNYRFRPAASLAEMAQDVATAAAWLKRHAAKYGGDGSRIALMGHSAGAHLVAAVGTNEAFMEAAGATLADLSGVVAIDTAMYNVPVQMKNAGAAHANAFGTDRDAWIAGFALAPYRSRKGHPAIPAVRLRRTTDHARASAAIASEIPRGRGRSRRP